MPRIRLDVQDPANRFTIKTILEADGHTVADDAADAAITDSFEDAETLAQSMPAIVLAGAATIRRAVDTMKRGVFGYIYLPLQPGEVEMMVRRALAPGAAAADFVPKTLEEVEREHIRATLRHCRDNRGEAAKLLGIGRNTLWRKLNRSEKEQR